MGREEAEPVSGSESSSVSSEESSEESEDSSDEELPSYENGMPGDYLPQFEELYSQNPDVVGYLEIEGTDFAYPVVQYTDNEYYLRRGFDGEENENGTPFVDYRTNLRTTQNTIVYGHNMRTGTMFETLLQYRDMNFYKEHPTLTFDSAYEEGEYKVIGMFIANTRPEDGPSLTISTSWTAPRRPSWSMWRMSGSGRSSPPGWMSSPGTGSSPCPPVPMSSPRHGSW